MAGVQQSMDVLNRVQGTASGPVRVLLWLKVGLYELLTGSTPLDQDTVKQKALFTVLQIIREHEPPRPSKRLSDSGEAISGISAQRRIEPAQLSRILKGDLDWVVMKALEKDRTRRYETAAGLANDVRRYLNYEPVQARPPSFRYRFGKFARKHRAAVFAAAAVLTSLILGILATSGLATWALAERKRADIAAASAISGRQEAERARADEARARRDSEALTEFLMSEFESQVSTSNAHTLTIGGVLDRAERKLDEELKLNNSVSARRVYFLVMANEKAGRINEAMLLWARCGAYYNAVQLSGRANHEHITKLIDMAIAQDVDRVRDAGDCIVVGELRSLAEHFEAGEAAIRVGLARGATNDSFYKSLGLVLLHQRKSDAAREAFQNALTKSGLRRTDGNVDLAQAHVVNLAPAYFLDLITEDEFAAASKDDKKFAPYPWFYIGQRKELEDDREAAISAYQRSVELGDDETAEKTRALAKWRLVELSKEPAASR